MAIGIEKKGYKGKNVSESDGQAYQFSGLLLDEIQEQEIKLALRTPWPQLDDEMKVSLQLASVIMDGRRCLLKLRGYCGYIKTRSKSINRNPTKLQHSHFHGSHPSSPKCLKK